MNAEIVTIGTELLLGQIIDTNATYIAQELNSIGINVLYKTTVGDNPGRMKEVLRRAMERADVVITTGGLGPTEVDLTRQIAAEVTGRKLALQPHLLKQIRRIFEERGLPFKTNNERQAYIPEGAIPIENPQGTAPGYIIKTEQGILLSLPGVPREMECLMQQTVLPYLKEKLGSSQTIKYKVLKLVGIGESTVDDLLKDLITTSSNPSIGLLAHAGQIDIRITAKAETTQDADRLITRLEDKIRARLPYQIFGVNDETQESVIANLLQAQQLTLAVAEMNTGGHICQRLMRIPEISRVFRGGVVVTDLRALRHLLNLPKEFVDKYDLISLETAKRMAEAVKDICGTNIGLGVAGHTQSKEGKVVDLSVPSFIVLSRDDGSFTVKQYKMAGSPELVQTRVSNIALELLRQFLLGIGR